MLPKTFCDPLLHTTSCLWGHYPAHSQLNKTLPPNLYYIKSTIASHFTSGMIYVPDGSTGMNIVPLAALLTGVILTLGIAVLLIVVLAIRRRRDVPHCADNMGHCAHQLELDSVKQQKMSPQPSSPNSMLEINTGDHRYVVAYTLKPVAECGNMPGQAPIPMAGTEHQPDILNTPRGNF